MHYELSDHTPTTAPSADPGLLSDDDLLQRLRSLLGDSRRAEADLVAHIGEVDARRLFAREAFPSMFVYCTAALHLSEAEALLRITAARAARRFPEILVRLADGRLTLSSIARLAPHLTPDDYADLLERATHKSRREIEGLVAELAPRRDVPGAIRKLPARAEPSRPAPEGTPQAVLPPAGHMELCPDRVPSSVTSGPPARSATSGPPARVEQLAPERYKVQFTTSAAFRDKLERLQALMRSKFRDGDLAALIEEAITEKLERLEARRFGRTTRPRKAATAAGPRSRHVPAALRRAVYHRDGGRCRFVDAKGRRCPETNRLEYHHRRPYAAGGVHALENVSLMCRAHNLLMAECDYGKGTMDRHRSARHLRADPTASS